MGVTESETSWTQPRDGPTEISQFSIAELLGDGSSEDEEEDQGFGHG